MTGSAGRVVFRVWFGDATEGAHDRVEAELHRLGALTEWSSRNLLAVDADGPDAARTVEKYLERKPDETTYEVGSRYIAPDD